MADWKDKIIEGVGYDNYDGILNTLDSDTDLTLVDTDNPVDIMKFAKLLFGTLVATVFIGISAIHQAVLGVVESTYRALGNFGGEVVSEVLATPGGAIQEATTTSAEALEVYGILGLVVAVGVTFSGLYAVAKAVEVIR